MGAPEGSDCPPNEPQVVYLIQGHDITDVPCWCAQRLYRPNCAVYSANSSTVGSPDHYTR
jgi:hypothetical protein